jgi:ATP phosphoribosyltransferase
VEAACRLGLADGVVDLVETGTTMKAAGLEALDVLLNTEAVLIANPKSQHTALVDKVKRRFAGYLAGLKYSMVCYNVPELRNG